MSPRYVLETSTPGRFAALCTGCQWQSAALNDHRAASDLLARHDCASVARAATWAQQVPVMGRIVQPIGYTLQGGVCHYLDCADPSPWEADVSVGAAAELLMRSPVCDQHAQALVDDGWRDLRSVTP